MFEMIWSASQILSALLFITICIDSALYVGTSHESLCGLTAAASQYYLIQSAEPVFNK